MAPSPGDEALLPESKSTGGFAGVLRGLAGGKLSKSPSLYLHTTPSTTSQIAAEETDAAHTPNVYGLPPDQIEAFKQLKSGSPSERIAAANSLRYAIAGYPFHPVIDIWHAGRDLINQANPTSTRVAGWELLTACTKHPSSSELERREYFDTVTSDASPEDFYLQLAALEDLTNHGRNVTGFYYDIFPVLTAWLQSAYQAAKEARKQVSNGSSRVDKGKTLSSGEDKNFSQLFAFIKDVIKFNFKFATDTAIRSLMDRLLKICMTTTAEEDLKACIHVIDTLVTYGTIPNDRLKGCINVLGSIHCMVPNLQKDAWHTLGNICKSHHGQSTVRILIDVLRNFSTASKHSHDKDFAIREVRGALSVLKKLTSKSVEKGYPSVPFTLLVDGLINVSYSTSAKVSTDLLLLVNALLDGPEGKVNHLLLEENWTPIFAVAARSAERCGAVNPPKGDLASKHAVKREGKSDEKSEDAVRDQLRCLISRVETLVGSSRSEPLHQDECIGFLIGVHPVLPDPAADLVLSYFKDRRSCLPSEESWEDNLKLVLEGFYMSRDRRPSTRLEALKILIEVYEFLSLVPDMVEPDSAVQLVERVLSSILEENDTFVLQETISFMAKVADEVDGSVFEQILACLREVVVSERHKSSLSQSAVQLPALSNPADRPSFSASQSRSNVATRGYIQIFIRSMNRDASKACKAFEALVHIARSNACETDARLTAMKMLFRLRADFEHRIYLAPDVDCEGLAETLCRTEKSLARKLAEDAPQPSRLSRTEQAVPSRPSRGVSFTQGQIGERGAAARLSSSMKPVTFKSQRLWSIPDADALPEEPPTTSSYLLFSCVEAEDDEGGNSGKETLVLKIGFWLDALQKLFHQGCDWEVYSFVLVHLPSQLCNHPIFVGAVGQVQGLRRTICEMIRNNSFHEPPSLSGLRRHDVANCLFHSLAMMISYHRYFQKQDEDEMVRTFMHGITDKTAKTCIHALSVCAHELPLSVSKSLVTILQRMSQVITQPFVAMHILEFLACLGRLHSLHSNFREDEYRIVFGICFRYLQYVRDKKRSTRSMHPSELPTSSGVTTLGSDAAGLQSITDDLPQYVYTLAYHVITFWFLAVKVPDRATHIGWIAKNLFTDVDGSPTNEEQAQITMDFMQRAAYSDINDTIQDAHFNEEYFGEILKKRWIIGNSIVTIKQAKESGWAEVTRRYPSGTSTFSVKANLVPMFGHQVHDGFEAAAWEDRLQTNTTIYPSYLLMQLLAPIPLSFDPILRPIPLPDEDAVDRAIRLFDRNSPVDGHKVGVIYIKEGQTKEADILANTIGSPDYVEFLNGLGTLTRLKGALFNTQGLDREYDTDGLYTLCWRDRVTEMVFHVTTQMPTNLAQDPQCVMKKRHIGNDFVNIIFNDSGLPFRFDTFPSEFNYVNIVVTPSPRLSYAAVRERASRRHSNGPEANDVKDNNASDGLFFTVKVMSKPGFPEISPAAEPKLISLKALPSFVRLLALNASVFSLVWANREGGEHVSSWRSRLREINRLRERYGPKVALLPIPAPSTIGSSTISTMGGTPTGMGMGSAPMQQVQQSLQPFAPQQQAQLQQGQGPGQQGQTASETSRPSSSVRDSFSSLRRSSVATFFTTASTEQTQQTSHRSSMLSTAAAGVADNTSSNNGEFNTADALVDSLDFSRWA